MESGVSALHRRVPEIYGHSAGLSKTISAGRRCRAPPFEASRVGGVEADAQARAQPIVDPAQHLAVIVKPCDGGAVVERNRVFTEIDRSSRNEYVKGAVGEPQPFRYPPLTGSP